VVELSVPVGLASSLRAILEAFEAFRAGAAAGTADFRSAEEGMYGLFAAAESAAIGGMLGALDPAADRVEVDGRAYSRLSLQTGIEYHAMRGTVRVQRGLYREEGVRNGPTIVPLDLRAGVVDGHVTPAAARGIAALAQGMPSREAEDLCRTLGVLPYSRSEHLRVGVRLGGRWEKLRQERELALLRRVELPEDAAAVSIAADRVSVPMAEERPLTAEDKARGVRKPYTVQLRMAFAGVTTVYDRQGEPVACIRHAHVPDGGAEALQAALRTDLDQILAQRPDLKLVLLSDGAPEMESIVDAAAADRPVAGRHTDVWHLLEKLGEAIDSTGGYVPDLLGDWAALLFEDDGAIEAIEKTLTGWAEEMADEVPAALHDALTYIANRRERLRYATSRAAGLPIGSGTVEATCKTIVGTRMRRPGASWEPSGAQAILGLRALWTSSQLRWVHAIDATLATYTAPVRDLPSKPRRPGRSKRAT
jgi:hypothetical protein